MANTCVENHNGLRFTIDLENALGGACICILRVCPSSLPLSSCRRLEIWDLPSLGLGSESKVFDRLGT